MRRALGWLFILTGIFCLFSTVFTRWSQPFLTYLRISPVPRRYHYYYFSPEYRPLPTWLYLAAALAIVAIGYRLVRNFPNTSHPKWPEALAVFVLVLGWAATLISLAIVALRGPIVAAGLTVYTPFSTVYVGPDFSFVHLVECLVTGAILLWIGFRLLRSGPPKRAPEADSRTLD